MPAPGFLSDVALWPWYLPHSEDRTITLDFVDDNGDPTDPGVVTVDAGAAWAIPATVTGTGSSRTVTWDAEQTVALADGGILGGKWRLRIGGVYKMGGQIRASSPTAAPTSGAWTVALPTGTGTLTVTIAAGGGGPVDADQVVTPTYTGRLAGIDPDVQSVLDMIDAGLDDHYVALFVADGDYSGGTLTAATLYDTGYPVPRENLVGALVCVVSGDDMGLWTITASGPCTPGRAVDPGDVIRAYGQGLVALAGSSNGADVSGINVAATAARVDAVSAGVDGANATIAALTGTVNGVVTEVGTLTNEVSGLHVVGDADAVAGDLRDRATVEAAPTAWAVCGEQDATFGDACYFRCATVLPPPTSTLEVRATARFRSHKADSPFAEIWSEPKDAGGMPGAGGVWDRYELAFWSVVGATVNPEFNRLWLFWEYTEGAGTVEQWLSGTEENPSAVLSPAYGSSGAALPANTWVTVAVFMDMATGTTAVRVRTDTTWDFEHPDDGTRWRTLRTYTTDAGTTSLAASDEVEQWIGRGGGRFDVARVQVWLDGVAAMDFDPSTALDEATTVTDSVLLDASDDPAVWEAHDLAVIHNP